MKKIKKLMAYILVFALCAGVIGAGAYEVQAADTCIMNISVKYGQTEARSMLQKINEMRTGSDAWYWASDNVTKVECAGLSELVYDYTLEKVAMQRAAEIAIYYSHTRPNGQRCFSAYSENGYAYYRAGENIAAGYRTAEDVFIGWAEEYEDYSGQGHRRNMLGANYTAVGIGHVYYNGYHYWVQEFGYSPNSNTAYVEPNDTDTLMSIEVALSEIQSIEPGEQPTVKVAVGNKAEVPGYGMKVLLTSTWPGRKAPVDVEAEWSVADSSYAVYSEGKITGVSEGTTTLNANICGQDIMIPVVVTPAPSITDASLYLAENTREHIVTGVVATTSEPTDIEYRWSAKDSSGSTQLIQDWTLNYEWLNWTPDTFGEYTLIAEARVAGNPASSKTVEQVVYFNPHIKGKCQVPYAMVAPGQPGYLIGVETYENPNQSYQYEMLILDCTLLAEGKDAWVYSTGKFTVTEGAAGWCVWQPEYGYYWTLFRVYDKAGNMIDQACYPFVNAY